MKKKTDNNRINGGLAKAAPLRYASFTIRLCGALACNQEGK